jgi:cysteine desulfurase/selenocysteine lyase
MRDVTADFPILSVEPYGKRLVYLDSANSSQKPRPVLDRMMRFYETEYANVARAAHYLGEKSTAAYEEARHKVSAFIGAPDWRGLVFTKNITEALNLVAHVLPLGPGDKVVITAMEHHANIVPWQLRCQREGARLEWIEVDPATGRLVLDDLDEKLDGAKIVSLAHVSNSIGTINPVEEITRRAHDAGALVCIDGAQAAPNLPLDIGAIGADFYGLTGHKMCGPTGVGVLWARPELLEEYPPFLGGGEMIRDVRREYSTWNDVPWKYEAGTPNIAQAVGLGAACDYLDEIGMDEVRAHEVELVAHAISTLEAEFGDAIRIWGPPAAEADDRGGAISFAFADIHPHDLATILDQQGVAIRAGHHCAKPLMRSLDVIATARASYYLYNSKADTDSLVEALREAARIFGV